MTGIDWSAVGTYLLPIITGVAGWFSGSRKRNNDFLADLQGSVDMLSKKNNEILTELIGIRSENAKLKIEVATLRAENAELKSEIELLSSKLEGVKTITKTVKKDEN